MSVCTGIELVETLSANNDLLKVTIDDNTEAYWFYSYSNALQYLNQDVIVEYRQDIYKGEMRQFIATFVIPTVITTLSKDTNIKLFSDSVDNYATLSFNEIQIGETVPNCIVYCVNSEFKSSAAATWQELIIRDKTMHIAKLRIFDYDNKMADFKGRYVQTDLSRNKYGFQSEFIFPIEGSVMPNAEIEIAANYIKTYFCNDMAAMDFMNAYTFIPSMKEYIDYEPGYGLVRLAMELSIVDSMSNVTNDVDLKSIAHALLACRGYITRNSELSPTVNNIIMASKIKWDNKTKVLKLLDIEQDEVLPERRVYDSVKDMVSVLLTVRKGIAD